MPDDFGKIAMFRRPGNAWMGELQRGENGPYATVANTVLILGCDEEIAGTVAYDEFAHRVVITKPPPVPFIGAVQAAGPYPRSVADTDVTLLQGYVQRTYAMRISQAIAQQAVLTAAEIHRVHPVREWLEGLRWDGVRRVDNWLCHAFGTPQNAYHRAVGAKVLAAAVRRVRQPGCKFDHVMVLEGKQGRGKSRACAALFGQDWFTDNLSHDLASKDAQQGMAGKWGIELAELNVLVRSTSQAAKAFFSRQVDYYRPPYGKSFVERPRQSVFIGTTNDADYLTDSTGNRRYWPVFCEKAEVAWISENREQLWAEAAEIEAEGEPLWLEDEALQRKALHQQSSRQAEDVWTNAIRRWLVDENKSEVKVSDLLHYALGLQRAQQTRAAEMRVAAIIRADGWLRHKHRGLDGKPTVGWFAPGTELPGRPGVKVPAIEAEDDDL